MTAWRRLRHSWNRISVCWMNERKHMVMKKTVFLIILIMALIIQAQACPVYSGEMPDFSEDGIDVMDPGSDPEEVAKSVSENIPVFRYYRPSEYYNVFVGDSRTVAIYNMTRGEECMSAFICQVGAGYGWFSSQTVKDLIRDYSVPSRDLNLIINMGVNDTENIAKYARYLNEMEPKWRAMGYKLYYVSVNPVGNSERLNNDHIDEFNYELENSLPGYMWLDTNGYLKDAGYGLSDRLHYDRDTSDMIYEYVVMNVD